MEKRVVFSVKIRESLRRQFTDTVKEKGLSTCFIMETLLTAWLEGLEAPAKAKVDQSRTIVINQHFSRVFVRGRRFLKQGLSDQWKDVDALGEVHETNRYLNPPGMWVYDPEREKRGKI